MNLSEKCELWVGNGILYETGRKTEISDETFDVLSQQLLKNYKKLPKWFRNKITEGELQASTASGVLGKFCGDTFEV